MSNLSGSTLLINSIKRLTWIMLLYAVLFCLYGCTPQNTDISPDSIDQVNSTSSVDVTVPDSPSVPTAESTDVTPCEPAQLNILFTSDLHSHFDQFDDNGTAIGGFSRIKTLALQNGLLESNTLFIDGGDFTTGLSVTGSPYSAFYTSDAAELRMLGRLGIDYTTLGNHELDFEAEGLSDMLSAAVSSNETVPTILICNIDWSSIETKTPDLKNTFEKAGWKKYDIIEKAGKRIAVIGVIGNDAAEWASDYNSLRFLDPVAAVRQTVDEIKNAGGADLYILLAHCGTNRALLGIVNSDEVYNIVDAVPELNLVLCGHTHTAFDEPITYNNATLIACGCYGRNLGRIVLQEDISENKKTETNQHDLSWNILEYQLIPVSEDIKTNSDIEDFISTFRLRL